jgi:hypothetical protein
MEVVDLVKALSGRLKTGRGEHVNKISAKKPGYSEKWEPTLVGFSV